MRETMSPAFLMSSDGSEVAEVDLPEQTGTVHLSSDDSRSESRDDADEADSEAAEQAHLEMLCVEAYEMIRVPEALEKLHLPVAWITEIRRTWELFIHTADSEEAAGERIWETFSPELVKAFSFPKAVFASRFINGVNDLVANCGEPEALKAGAEILAFMHLGVEASPELLQRFIDGVMSAMENSLRQELASESVTALLIFFNYLSGFLLFVRDRFALRVQLIHQSWGRANQPVVVEAKEEPADHVEDHGGESSVPSKSSDDSRTTAEIAEASRKRRKMKTPESFNEMFFFNASAMGYPEVDWMQCVLDHLGPIATHGSDRRRLQEECNKLALVLAVRRRQRVPLSQFKSVLLATLRSVLPQDWDLEHEHAWVWLWDNMAKRVSEILGKLSRYMRNVENLIRNLTDEQLRHYAKCLFEKLFGTTPRAQDHFKSSTTRLYFVVERILGIAVDIYRDPDSTVKQVSAIGLRHVGMNIPREMFAPLVAAAVESMEQFVDGRRPIAFEGFKWSMNLIAQIMARVNLEGATLVIKAISQQDVAALKRAIAIVPRGRRAQEVLTVSVGAESISPLLWCVDTGNLPCAAVILEDLLTIRGDRDVYYCGREMLFERHPDIVSQLCSHAPSLLWPLFDGLMWRSYTVTDNVRRVNYYIKNLLQDQDGNFNDNIECLAQHQDPQVMSHPATAIAVDMTWFRLAMFQFILQRSYFIFMLCVDAVSQSVLKHPDGSESRETNFALAACRLFLYVFSLGPLLGEQVKKMYQSIKIERTGIGPIPKFLLTLQGACSALLTVAFLVMLGLEPVIWCAAYSESALQQEIEGVFLFTVSCPQYLWLDWYSMVSSIAMLLHWMLLLDLSVLSMQVSAFLLTCRRMFAEVGLFLAALCFLILTFATSIHALNYRLVEFDGIEIWVVTLLKLALGMLPDDFFETVDSEDVVQILVAAFISLVSFVFLNLLLAQLVESYSRVFVDMQGRARLNRASLVASITETMPRKKWSSFLRSMRFEDPLAFNEGDLGPAGGIQVTEPASAHVVLKDPIQRFAGSSAPESPWPQAESDAEDRFERLEQMLAKLVSRPSGPLRRFSAPPVGSPFRPTPTDSQSHGLAPQQSQSSGFGSDD